MTLKIDSISKTTNFGKPNLEEYCLGQVCNRVGYHLSKFQLEHCNIEREIAFPTNFDLLTRFRNRSHHSPSIARISSQRRMGFFFFLLVNSVVS